MQLQGELSSRGEYKVRYPRTGSTCTNQICSFVEYVARYWMTLPTAVALLAYIRLFLGLAISIQARTACMIFVSRGARKTEHFCDFRFITGMFSMLFILLEIKKVFWPYRKVLFQHYGISLLWMERDSALISVSLMGDWRKNLMELGVSGAQCAQELLQVCISIWLWKRGSSRQFFVPEKLVSGCIGASLGSPLYLVRLFSFVFHSIILVFYWYQER